MKAIKIIEPVVCPFCGSPIVRQIEDGAHLYCSNPDCPERKIAKLSYFVAKGCMDIDGLSEKTIRKIYKVFPVSNWYDLYSYTVNDFASCGVGEKTALKIYNELTESKEKASPIKILVSLGIPMIGKVNATKLLEKFKSLTELEHAAVSNKATLESNERHAIVDIIGESAGNTLIDYINHNRNEFKRIYEIFNNISLEKKEAVSNENSPLDGMTILATGTLQHFSRDGIKDSIISNGGVYASGLSKKLAFLIIGENAGPSKIAKAKELGIKQVTEEEYLSMIKE